ncbi:MAG: hypothetical protein RRB13_12765 [bacterium]|nr:hypothetical protein [bacterium]
MAALQLTLKFLAFSALIFTFVEAYLSLNKIWKRKHEKVVAESISISAVFIGLFSGTVYSLDLALSGAWPSLVDQLVWVVFGVFQLFVAIGFWVAGERQKGIWKMIKSTFVQDRNEAADLVKLFIRPSGANQVLEILTQMAIIDQDLDDKEKECLDMFARDWNLKINWQDVENRLKGAKVSNYSQMHDSMEKYLLTFPPKDQVEQLIEVMNRLARLDEDFSESEQLILAELEGLKDAYVGGGADIKKLYIALVPQNKTQEEAMVNLFPNLERHELQNGSFAYWDGPFYSDKYAKTIAAKYEALSVFTTVTDQSFVPENNEGSQAEPVPA